MIKPPKPKKCKACGVQFLPSKAMQVVCNWRCAIVVGAKVKAKDDKVARVLDRRETKIKLDKLKSKSQWAKEAQTAFNAWVRTRDAGNACISCGRHHTGQLHAGHYLSVGARPELRYEPLNVHLQCAPCNTYLSGNAVLYRLALVKKIGQEKVDWLEGPHELCKDSIDDLKTLKADYMARTKKLKECL